MSFQIIIGAVEGIIPRHFRSDEDIKNYLKNNNLWNQLSNEEEERERLLSDKSVLKERDAMVVHLIVCKDSSGGLYISPVAIGYPDEKEIKAVLQDKVEKDTVLMTNSDDRHSIFEESEGITCKKMENLEQVQDMQKRINEYYFEDGKRAPSTKYLDLSCMLIWWLEKNKELSVSEKVEELYRIISNNNGLETITRKLIRNRELELNTRGNLPKRV